MSLTNVFNLFKTLEKESILLTFKGIVTEELLSSVLHIMEAELNHSEEPKRRKKVFNVLVECLQNLYHHAQIEDTRQPDEGELDLDSAVFMIGKDENGFYIRTGNYIEVAEAKDLASKLDRINSLEKNALRQFYQDILSEGTRSSKGTAGLGMIDIARKSGNKLDYEIFAVSPNHMFFCLNVKID